MISSILWYGLIAVFFFMMMRGGCGGHVMGHGHHSHGGKVPEAGTRNAGTAIDPVCGMEVQTATGKTSVYHGKVYYFCSANHRDTFEVNPELYINQIPPAFEHGESPGHA